MARLQSWRATKGCFGHLPGGWREVARGVLFWQRCVECLLHFTHNTYNSLVEVSCIPTIFMTDPHMQLKRKRLGLVIHLKEGRREKALE